MFDFIFKRTQKKAATTATPTADARTAAAPAPLYDARTAARHRAEALQHDEAASLAFLLQCEFAEARLIAAQAIQSKESVRQALDALRNTDRRVARLMQARLDVLLGQEKLMQACQACTAEAQRLAQQERLTPNQVSELDRRWQALLPVPDPLQQAFDTPRQALALRLATQADLQRAAIDTLARLTHLRQQVAQASLEPAQSELPQLDAAVAGFAASPESGALPKNLLAQCVSALQILREEVEALATRQSRQLATQRARSEQMEQWEALPPAELQIAAMRRNWTALGATDPQQVDESQQQRFDALLERVRSSQPAAPAIPGPVQRSNLDAVSQASATANATEQTAVFNSALLAMEAALQDGALQAAAEADKRIRALDSAALRSAGAQAAQLSRLRAELARLQGWARWGGNVSREELQKAAEALPAQELAVSELAKQIGALRARWKALDSSAGPAPKELWHGFDAACTAAYAPVAAQVEKQIAERQKNAELASAMIAQLHQYADQLASNPQPDWKDVAQFCQRNVQNFQRLAHTDRRNKKRFETEFAAALARIQQPLATVRDAEIAQREQMIAEASQLNATERGALDRLKQLQERWQERAKGMPLERQDEQSLWRRFREACDTAFAKRKEFAAEADAERRQHLAAKESLCDQLEAALHAAHTDAAVSAGTPASVLREVSAAWSRIGPVPRDAEAALEARYRTAMAGLTQQIEASGRQQRSAARQAAVGKLALCLEAEAALADRAEGGWSALHARWQALGPDDNPTQRTLAQRFARAQACAAQADPAYLTQLVDNRALVRQELLRSEIILSLDSPADSARERLQMQVEVLQSALKSTAAAPTAPAQLQTLCSMPVALDGTDTARLLRVVEHLVA